MKQIYFERWNSVTKEFRELLTEREAQRRHDAGIDYSVAFFRKTANQPDAFLSVDWRGAGIEFLNEQLQSYLDYSFEKQPDGRLFLVHSTYRRFQGSEGRPREAVHMRFDPEGNVVVTVHNLLENTTQEGTKAVDVSGNWDAFPDFGKYENLLQEER